jgi:hypothetical protein
LSLGPHPFPKGIERYRLGVVDFEMRPGPWALSSVSEVGLVVAESSGVRCRVSSFASRSLLGLEQLAIGLRLHLYGCDYLAGYGPLELAVLREVFRAPIGGRYIDVLEAARWVRPDLSDHSLDNVCTAFGIAATIRHRALPDAEAALACLLALIVRKGSSTRNAR